MTSTFRPFWSNCLRLVQLSILIGPAQLYAADTSIQLLADPVSIAGHSGTMSIDNLQQMTMKSSGRFAMNCAPISELQGALLCLANQQRPMNDALIRMGYYMGAGARFAPGSLVEKNNPSVRIQSKYVKGHNLPGDVILGFFAGEKTNTNLHLALNPREKQFYDVVVESPQISTLGNHFYVIAVYAHNRSDIQQGITHEIRHAYYYLRPEIQAAVKGFWQARVSEADKLRIRSALRNEGYNNENEDLVVDEFQAYILEDNAKLDTTNPIPTLVDKYAPALRTAVNGATLLAPVE